MRAIEIEGYVLGFFVILNGVYVVLFPPPADEPQGIAIAAIGIFIIIATKHLADLTDTDSEAPPLLP